MRFSKKKGRQTLDLSGNLIVTRNAELISKTSSSAAPNTVQGARWVSVGESVGFWGRVKATLWVIGYVWGGE